jgi:hypothetical protein
MSIQAIGVLADTALDTTMQINQGQYVGDTNTKVSLARALGPSLLVGGSYLAHSILDDDPFAKAHRGFMKDMRKAGTRQERRNIAETYFNSGRYGAQAERAAASIARKTGQARVVSKISTASRFAQTAEVAYMRKMAAVSIGRFAMAANAALFLAPALFGATYHGFKGVMKAGYELETPKMGGHFIVNAMQATDRQRALMAMHQSEFNGRSYMGNEAFLMHQ